MIKLGTKVKDSITGCIGIATAKAEYLTGCIRYLVELPASKNGDLKEYWFDEDRLGKHGASPKKKKKKKPTGGSSNPPSKRYKI